MHTHRAMFILASCSTTVNFHEFSKIELLLFFVVDNGNSKYPFSVTSLIFSLSFPFSIYYFSFAQALQFLNTQELVR